MTQKKRIIVVLGMHRSGTSAVTRGLEALSVNLGDNLHPANYDNPTGFWENRACLEINAEVLSRLDSAYDLLGGKFSELPELLVDWSDLRARASSVLEEMLSKFDGIWAFKDPRTSRLLPFWKEVALSSDIELQVLLVVRNPVEVALSLLKRNGLPIGKSCLLWVQHNLFALRDSVGLTPIVVSYDSMLKDPYQQLLRMGKKLSLPTPKEDGESYGAYAEFLSSDLRHHEASDLIIPQSQTMLDLVQPLDNLLNDLANDVIDENESTRRLELCAEKYSKMDMLFDLLANFERYVAQVNIGAVEITKSLENAPLRESWESIVSPSIQLETLPPMFELLKTHFSEIDSLRNHMHYLDHQIYLRDQEIERSASFLTKSSEEKRRVEEKLDDTAHDLEISKQTIVSLEARIDSLAILVEHQNRMLESFARASDNNRSESARIASIVTELSSKNEEMRLAAIAGSIERDSMKRQLLSLQRSNDDLEQELREMQFAASSQQRGLPLDQLLPENTKKKRKWWFM